MAQEIRFSAVLQAIKSGAVVNSGALQGVLDLAGAGMMQQPQSIATSATALDLAAVGGAPKKLLIANLDAANYVEIDSVNTFTNFPQKILAGDVILLSPETATIYAKAHTAACILFVVAVGA